MGHAVASVRGTGASPIVVVPIVRCAHSRSVSGARHHLARRLSHESPQEIVGYAIARGFVWLSDSDDGQRHALSPPAPSPRQWHAERPLFQKWFARTPPSLAA